MEQVKWLTIGGAATLRKTVKLIYLGKDWRGVWVYSENENFINWAHGSKLLLYLINM